MGKSPIAFSQQREDPAIELQICRMITKRRNMLHNQHSDGVKVLLIGSGGCTALSLLSSNCVQKVHAVDMNPAQIQISKLKQYLIRYAPYQEFQIKLLGGDPATSEEERLQLYQEFKNKYFTENQPERNDFFKWWDSHPELIKLGPNRAGVYEEIFRELVSDLANFNLINNPEQAIVNKDLWNKAFSKAFDTQKLIEAFGENAVNFSKSQSFADHFSSVFRSAISKFDAKQNYFLHSIWRDSYYKSSPNGEFFKSNVVSIFQQLDSDSDGLVSIGDLEKRFNILGLSLSHTELQQVWKYFNKETSESVSLSEFISSLYQLHSSGHSGLESQADEAIWELLGPASLPIYLLENAQKRLLKNNFSEKIHWHLGSFDKLISELSEKYGPFDVIQTSNITDWAPIPQCNELMATCHKYLAEGGAVISRRLNGDYNLSEVISRHFSVDTAFQNQLLQNDRSFFYSEVVVGWKMSFGDLQMFKYILNPLSQNQYSVATPISTWLTPSVLSSLPSFEAVVNFLETVFDFKTHPYFVWLRKPTTTKEQVLESLIPFAFAVEQWSQAVAAVISQMDYLEDRIKIFDNLSEEHGHLNIKKAHKFTYYEFLEALGGGKDLNTKECPVHMLVFNQTLANFCKTHSSYAGAACLGIIESLYIGISVMISNVIFSRGWVVEGQQHHYDVHAVLDVEHARELLNVAKPGWNENSPSLKKEISIGFLLAAQSFWQLYGNMFLTIPHIEIHQEVSQQQQAKEQSVNLALKNEYEIVNFSDLESDLFPLGLKLLAADSSKLSLFHRVGKNFLTMNLPILSKKFYKSIYEEDGWEIQESVVTGRVRLLDANKKQQAYASKEGLRQTFLALLQSRDLWEEVKPQQSLSIKCLQSEEEFATFSPIISQLEKGVKYPLGSDFFEIDHGKNYFSFFQRLGNIHYYTIMDNQEVCSVICGALRTLKKNGSTVQAWYICDLKVFPKYRNQRLTMYLASRVLPKKYLLCSRGYFVSMNPEGGPSQNRVISMLRKFRWAPFNIATQLNLYSLSAAEMNSFGPTLEKLRGKLSYLSLRGVKDIVLESTHQPMPLLHVQFGPCAEEGQYKVPQEGHTHMFCTPENDPLAKACQEAGLKPTATASVLNHRMADWDWNFILTSDI